MEYFNTSVGVLWFSLVLWILLNHLIESVMVYQNITCGFNNTVFYFAVLHMMPGLYGVRFRNGVCQVGVLLPVYSVFRLMITS